MRLLLRVLGTKRHPSNHEQMPFISARVEVTDSGIRAQTRGSNALPPVWKEEFVYSGIQPLRGSMRIALFESRLFMQTEEIANGEFCLENLPLGKVVLEWVPLRLVRCEGAPVYALVMLQIVGDDEEFDKNGEIVRMDWTDSLPFVYSDDCFFLPDDMQREEVDDSLKSDCLKDILNEISCNK